MPYVYVEEPQQKPFLQNAATGALYGTLIGAATGNIGRGALIGTAAGGLLGPSVGRNLGLPGFGGGSRHRRHRRHSRSRRHSPSRRHSRSRRHSHSRVHGGNVVALQVAADSLSAGRFHSRRAHKHRRRLGGGAVAVADVQGGALVVPVEELAMQLEAEVAQMQGGRSRRRSRHHSRSRRSRRHSRVRGGVAPPNTPVDLAAGAKRRRRRSRRRA